MSLTGPEPAVADALVDLVRGNPPAGGVRGDTAAEVMYGTYVKAFRRFVRIRDLAREEALILTRSLLSMVARAIWIDQPDPVDKVARRARFERWKKRDLRDQLNDVETLVAAGFDVDADLEELRNGISRLDRAEAMPNDRALLEDLRMTVYYARLYRLGSQHVHYSLELAIREIATAIEKGQDLPLEQREPELASEALSLAILTYGLFLDMAERTVRHGLTSRVTEIVSGVLPFEDAAS